MSTDKQRLQFFEQLLAKSNAKTPLFKGRKPNGSDNWVSSTNNIILYGHFNYRITLKDSLVEFYLTHDDPKTNQRRHEILKRKKTEIENIFGESLVWGEYTAEKVQRKIQSKRKPGGIADDGKWSEIQDDLANRMVRFEKALHDFLMEMKD
ncbi:DUF4268 domain-containing protein [Thermodesulfobacteriota bacterium]